MKLSIITINRNNDAGLRRTIESVVSQSYTDFEYIIIDGASKDGSVEVIKEYSHKITYWVSEPDTGIYNAMNKGIKVAKGEYCLFLNSGDYLVNNEIIKKIFLEKHKADIICGYVGGFKNNQLINLYPPEKYTFRFMYGHNIPHQAEFICRTLLLKSNLYNENFLVLSDYEFNIKALLAGAVFKNIQLQVSVVDFDGISSDDKNNHLFFSEGNSIFKNLIPDSIFEDYMYFLNTSTFSHPAIKWLIQNKLFFLFVKFVYKFTGKK